MITTIVELLLLRVGLLRVGLLLVSAVVLLTIRLLVEASVVAIDDDNFGLLLHLHVRHVGLSSCSTRFGHGNTDASEKEEDADPHETVPESPGLNIAAVVVVVIVTVFSLGGALLVV